MIIKNLKPTNTAHRLLDYKGKCENIHGHCYSYSIKVYVKDFQQKNSISLDFNEFKEINDWLQDNWDHATLVSKEDKTFIDFLENQKMHYFILPANTTVETMSRYLYNRIKDFYPNISRYKYSVCISETNNNFYEYSKGEKNEK